jgi:addiction module HigA family antidote
MRRSQIDPPFAAPHGGAPTAEERSSNPHPGEAILEDWLRPLGKSAYWLAKGTGISQIAISQILRGQRAITPATALRLSRFLGCSSRLWLGLQAAYDLAEEERRLAPELAKIRHYRETEELSEGREG